ncbi:hypothetical protein OAT18_02465 [Tenacibaculum sp.]|nr:hypothetical protein [Tenacibaculum sp.]
MKKQILNLGKALNKAQQTIINGGSEADWGCPRFCEENGYICRPSGNGGFECFNM